MQHALSATCVRVWRPGGVDPQSPQGVDATRVVGCLCASVAPWRRGRCVWKVSGLWQPGQPVLTHRCLFCCVMCDNLDPRKAAPPLKLENTSPNYGHHNTTTARAASAVLALHSASLLR